MPDLAAAWNFLENSDPIASAQEVEDAIARLSKEISAQLAEAYPWEDWILARSLVGPIPTDGGAGDTIKLTVHREGKATELTATLKAGS